MKSFITSGLIWIKTVWNSEQFLKEPSKNIYFEVKISKQQKICKISQQTELMTKLMPHNQFKSGMVAMVMCVKGVATYTQKRIWLHISEDFITILMDSWCYVYKKCE